MRLAVFLPFATASQVEAGSEALRLLLQDYPDASIFGHRNAPSPEWWPSYEAGATAPDLQPACHGVWINAKHGRSEYDSHLVFVTYANETEETLPSALARLEEVLYVLYYTKARKNRDPNTYQKLVFIEAWLGVHVRIRRRRDLSDTIT